MWNDPFNHIHHIANQHGWGGPVYTPAPPTASTGLGLNFGASASA